MKKYILFLFIIICIIANAEQNDDEHGIVYVDGIPKYLNWGPVFTKATPQYKKHISSKDYTILNIEIIIWGNQKREQIFEITTITKNNQTTKINNRRENFLYKENNDGMFISKIRHINDFDFLGKPYWEKIDIEVRGLRVIKEFDNRVCMIVYLKSGFFEGEFAIIEH